MTTPQHSKVGFSSRKRWKNCPGSVRLSAGIESRSSVHADEGTAAHALQQYCLDNEVAPLKMAGLPFKYDDHGVSKYIVVSQEMAQHIHDVCGAIWTEAQTDDDCVLLVEERFHLKSLHKDLFGTGDVVIWFPSTRKLQVRDLKYGAGVAVEVEEDGQANEQLEGYALGALLAHPEWLPLEVELVVDQPRAFHAEGPTRRSTLPVGYFVEMAADLLDEVRATEAPDAPLHPGDHCRWCPASAVCPEQRSLAQKHAKKVFQAGLPYDPKELSEVMDWLPVIEAWIKNTREFCYAEAEKGNPIPSYKLVAKVARRKWRDEDAVVAKLLPLVDASELYDAPTLKTVAVIEKLLPKDQRSILDDLVTKESSGHTLVHETDKRPAVKVDAKSAFA